MSRTLLQTGRPLVLLAILLVACRDKTPKPQGTSTAPRSSAEGAHTDEPAHDALPTRVRLSPKVVLDAKIRTEPVITEELAATLMLPGEVGADPDRSARVSTPVAGRIANVQMKEGSFVEKGAALATIRVPELGRVRAAQSATTSKAIAARSNADRLTALAEKGMAARQEATAARAEAEALETEANALRDQLRALGASGGGSELVLRAPVAGVLVSRDAVVGQPVGADHTLATIADLRTVWFLARVFEKDLARVHDGAAAEVQLNAYPDERFVGTVEYLGKQIDPVARTVTARIRLKNRQDLLRLGLFGSARIVIGRDAGGRTLTIPRSALTEIAGKTVAFVRHDDDDFEVHYPTLGREAPGRVEVLSGLREGEQVVTEGVFTLKSSVLKGTFGEEE
jgi:cobalt-zinc-cadmium efflux system membrane fusion protein